MLDKLSKLTPKKTEDSEEKARNWYRDRYESVRTQRNSIAVFTVCCLAFSLISAFSILTLLPSKTIMPFVIQVDKQSGVVETMDPESQKQITADQALIKYFVAKFIRAREGYDANDLTEKAEIIRLMSTQQIYNKYFTEVVSSSSKQSYRNTLGKTKIRAIRINSFQFLDTSLVSVRLAADVYPRGEPRLAETNHYIALIKFEFANLDLTLEQMTVNPLGFYITDYKLEEEAVR